MKKKTASEAGETARTGVAEGKNRRTSKARGKAEKKTPKKKPDLAASKSPARGPASKTSPKKPLKQKTALKSSAAKPTGKKRQDTPDKPKVPKKTVTRKKRSTASGRKSVSAARRTPAKAVETAAPESLADRQPRGKAGERKPGKRTAAQTPRLRRGIVFPEKTFPADNEQTQSPSLPEEYGENDLFLIAVDPDVVYSSWEIRKEDVPKGENGPIIRFFDVTAIDFDGTNAWSCLDIPLPARVGTGFFPLGMPGRVVVAEIGYFGEAEKFTSIRKSQPLQFPPWPGPDDVWPDGYGPESEKPPGY